MLKLGRFLLGVMTVTLLLVAASVTQSYAQIKELPVYNEWQGRNSTFKAERPFFLIRDIHDLNLFWAKSGADEPAPGIDFSRFMLLVWCPGSSLFDFVPVSVERFLYKEGNYFALMQFERKDTGGFWRNPFMATMLPRVTSGDIFIMRKVTHGAHRVSWKPFFTIWDMSGQRKRPFEVARFEQPPEKPGFIAHAPEPAEKEPPAASSVVQSPQAVSQPAGQSAPTEVASSRATAVSGFSGTSSQAQAGQGSAIEDWPDVKPVAETSSKPASQPVQKIDEDPLFGTEFDITF
jgi:hypothetical protein